MLGELLLPFLRNATHTPWFLPRNLPLGYREFDARQCVRVLHGSLVVQFDVSFLEQALVSLLLLDLGIVLGYPDFPSIHLETFPDLFNAVVLQEVR